MVRVGAHSLQLVDAATKRPLPEHSHKNQTYVVGRAGDEFLLRITSHTPNTRTVASPITVDGCPIGYNFQQGPTRYLTADLAPVAANESDSAGHAAALAFRFAAPPPGAGSGHSGEVAVTWSEAEETNVAASHDANRWGENAAATAADGKKSGVGALKSTTGATATKIPWAATTWKRGRQLYTITLKYIEEAGLVALGHRRAPTAAAAAQETIDLTGDDDAQPARAVKRQKREDGQEEEEEEDDDGAVEEVGEAEPSGAAARPTRGRYIAFSVRSQPHTPAATWCCLFSGILWFLIPSLWRR